VPVKGGRAQRMAVLNGGPELSGRRDATGWLAGEAFWRAVRRYVAPPRLEAVPLVNVRPRSGLDRLRQEGAMRPNEQRCSVAVLGVSK